MKTSTVLIGAAVLAAAGAGFYFYEQSKKKGTVQQTAKPSSGSQPNQTLATVSQAVGIGQQAANLFGTAVDDYNKIND